MNNPNIKSDLMDLEKLLESAKVADGIEVTDDSTYNVLTREGAPLTENSEAELTAILEGCVVVNQEYKPTTKQNPTKKAPFGMLEAIEEPMKVEQQVSNQDMTALKGKKILLRHNDKEMPVIVANIDDKKATLKGLNGGLMNLSVEALRKIFVKTLTESEENKEGLLEMDLGKEHSPVKDDKKVQENPSGDLTEPGKIDFSKLPAVEHDKFVKNALDAKNTSDKSFTKNLEKLPKNVVDTRILKHAGTFKDFVNGFKEANPALVECVLKGFDAYVEHIKTKNDVK